MSARIQYLCESPWFDTVLNVAIYVVAVVNQVETEAELEETCELFHGINLKIEYRVVVVLEIVCSLETV